MTTVHALETIANEGMTPVASATASAAGSAAKLASFSLYEAFVIKAQQDSRIDVLCNLVSLTFTEFDKAMTDSLQLAANADTKDGWKPAEGAKGRDKYGPKQSAMAQRASEARQIFGYLKQTDPSLARGYLETLKAAREWLKAHNVDWTGADITAKKQAAETKRETEALAEATKQAMLTTPKPEGMTQGEWFAEVAKRAQAIIAKDADKAVEAKMTKACEGIVKAFEPIDAYSIGITLIHNAIQSGIISKDQVLADVASLVITEEAPL